MNKRLLPVTCLMLVCLVACQPAPPAAAPQPTTVPPASPATALPTAITLPTATLAPATSAPPTATPIAPVNITAFCTLIGRDAKMVVPQGTPVVITWGWEAKTEALVEDFLQNNITTVTLDGKVIEGVRSDGFVKNEKSGQPEVVWHADIGVLSPGPHPMTYDVKWKTMIDDGTTTYGPGGQHETLHDECQIIVE